MKTRKYIDDVPIEYQDYILDADTPDAVRDGQCIRERYSALLEDRGMSSSEELSHRCKINREILALNPESPGAHHNNRVKKKLGGQLFLLVGVLLLIGGLGNMIDQAASKQSNVSKSGQPYVVMNNPWDNSVTSVKRYLKNTLKDPSSLEIVRWGPVTKVEGEKYVVNVIYRAKNSFGGYATENQLFTMKKSGEIIGVHSY